MDLEDVGDQKSLASTGKSPGEERAAPRKNSRGR
jgi:hypothetical protein